MTSKRATPGHELKKPFKKYLRKIFACKAQEWMYQNHLMLSIDTFLGNGWGLLNFLSFYFCEYPNLALENVPKCKMKGILYVMLALNVNRNNLQSTELLEEF